MFVSPVESAFRLRGGAYCESRNKSALTGTFILLHTACGMGPLQLAVTWYKIRHAGEQAVHWDTQNKATSSRQIYIFFVLDVPVASLLSSMADFVPCDR